MMSNNKYDYPPGKWRQFFEVIRSGKRLDEAIAIVWGDGRHRDTIRRAIKSQGKQVQFDAARVECRKVREERSKISNRARKRRNWRDRLARMTPEERKAFETRRNSLNYARRHRTPRVEEYQRLMMKSYVAEKRLGVDRAELRKAWGLDVGLKWFALDYSQHDVDVDD